MHDFPTLLTHTHVDETDSTNTQLINAISTGILSHTTPHLYTASHQTSGRGQHGRSWVSGKDNVFLSLYIPIGQGGYHLNRLSGLLSLTVGYELANLDIITHINHARYAANLPPIGVKWANDIGFYDEKLAVFQKLAGILIEPVFKTFTKNTLVGVVIGVGFNVHSSPIIKDGLYQATCLQALTDHPPLSAQEMYAPITNAIFGAVSTCNTCQDPSHLADFIRRFNYAHLLQGKSVQIFMQNNMTDAHTSGICVGIGNDGELLLDNQGQITPIYAGMAKIIKNIN